MSTSNKGPNVDSRLQNLTNALYLDGNDDVVVRTGFAGNIVISGNVNVPGNVIVYSTPENPVHTHVSEVGTSGILNVPWLPVSLDGNTNVGITSMPSITGNVGIVGNVNVNPITGTISVNNFPSTQTVNGTVSVNSIPAISGTVSVNNFPSTQTITGNANVTVTSLPNVNAAVTGTVTVGSITSNVNVNPISGNVGVSGNVGIIGNVNVTQGTTPWVVTGNANVTVTGNVTTVPDANVATLVKYIDSTNIQMDMTERLRVAPPTQSWWYAPSVDKDGDLRYIESITGTNSASVFVQNLAGIRLTPGSDSNGSVIRMSRRRHKMRPGVSTVYQTSMSFHGARTNVTKRAGMFTNYNGIFYEVSGGTLWVVVRRRLTDGTLIEKRTQRSEFNHDKLDGTGESGYDLTTSVNCNLTSYISKTTVTVNATTGQYCYNVVFGCDNPTLFAVGSRVGVSGISPVTYNTSALVQSMTSDTITLTYVIDPGVYSSMSGATCVQTALHKQYVYGFDFSGSRTTRVRFFMDTPRGKTVLHIEDFSGSLSTSFENAPALSTRYEIFNTGSVNTCAAITVCSEAVNVEAELELNPGFGVAHNLAHPVTFIKQNNGTEWAIMAVGLRSGEPYQRADLQIQGLQIADKGNINPQNAGLFYWRLVLNPTVVGYTPTPTNIGKATRKWEFTGNSTISGGTELLSGLTTSVSTIDTRTALNFINLGSNIEYTDADKVFLSVQQVVGGTDNASIIATINFIESL
jgi:hypothetical protein